RMATRLQKIFWSLLAGAALGAGACGEGTPEYGAPVDTTTDEGSDPAGEVMDDPAADPAVDPTEEEPMSTDYGPVADV
ncbi:MAG: hypothetical protein JRG91_13355, partial [Deltaproteobacteria bacterium]|nr:hypothetical protein [Deltaproteobacteria bacterium]